VALGWDVNHERQTNPYEQEVKVERGVVMSAGRKRADYAFLAPNFHDVLFYVEAKKPKAELDNSLYYFQTIRYGWNGRTPLSVLTDFEQFRVLDCRYKPDLDTALHRAVKKFHYADYFDPEKFAELYYLFSREAARGGLLEKYAAALPKPSGKAHQRTLFGGGFKSIDESFLADLDGYREELAQSFAKENPLLDSYELTEVTQRTLDRLVFMRFLEDKLIEQEPLVENMGVNGSGWQDFVAASHRLDRVYNGIIFKKHALLDSPAFKVDEVAFDDVRLSLAQTTSPYDFNAIPIHILGSIYERFLGKVITVTEKGAQVEEKPEVRKAGGVYYTPEYIVRYIVESTVGELIEGKTPEDVRQMRFADIACGSGSFLLGVYDLLLRFHTTYYNANKANKARGRRAGCIEREDGSLHLSLLQRRDILLNNIYGADVDPQAVEVAQLSLYLKLLEDENVATSRRYQLEFREALLPTLSNNIICGNSLIGWDILQGHLFDRDEERRLNPMEFENAFPQVMQSGGFDAIVGNPPYRMLQPNNTDKQTLEYLRGHYLAAEFKIELFHLFLQRAVSYLREGGRLGYIVPTTLLNNVYAETLRSWLLKETRINLISVARGRVFADADVHTTVISLCRESDASKRESNEVRTTSNLDEAFAKNPHVYSSRKQMWLSKLPGSVWNILIDENNARFITRLMQDFVPLGKVGAINRGLITGDKDKYFSPIRSGESHVPIIAGSDVHSYYTKPPSEFVLFERPKSAGGCWDREVHFAPHKIVIRQIGERPTASIVREPIAVTGNIFTVRAGELRDELYLLGLINSKLISFFWQIMFADFKSSFPQVTIFSLSQLPVCLINESNPADRERRDQIVRLVERMLAAKQDLVSAYTDRDRNFYERKCADLERQIDKLVYELYRLTDEDIAIIEAGG